LFIILNYTIHIGDIILKNIRIVVCGLGFAGLSFIKNIVGYINDIELVVIDKNPFHYLQPEVYKYIANEKLISDIILDLQFILSKISTRIKFINGKVENINLEENIVYTKNQEVKYDYLVLALGSKTFFPPSIKNLKNFSAGVKSIERAMYFKQSFEKLILKKMKEEQSCLNKSFNIVIGGGGLSGIEIASEMAVFQRRIFEDIGCCVRRTEIFVVEALPNILYGLDEFIIENSLNRLKELGITILTNKKIVSVSKDKVHFENNKYIETDFIIWTGGIIANNPIKDKVETNRKFQIKVDRYFRVNGIENVFAIGDCAEIVDFETGTVLPATADTSIQAGRAVAKHISSTLESRKLEPIRITSKGLIVSLGNNYAVGKIKNIRFKGYIAHLIKEFIFSKYKKSL